MLISLYLARNAVQRPSNELAGDKEAHTRLDCCRGFCDLVWGVWCGHDGAGLETGVEMC